MTIPCPSALARSQISTRRLSRSASRTYSVGLKVEPQGPFILRCARHCILFREGIYLDHLQGIMGLVGRAVALQNPAADLPQRDGISFFPRVPPSGGLGLDRWEWGKTRGAITSELTSAFMWRPNAFCGSVCINSETREMRREARHLLRRTRQESSNIFRPDEMP